MNTKFNIKSVYVVIFLTIFFSVFASTHASEQKNMKGWELDGAYNRLYNANEMDKFKAVVVDIIDTVPMPGMSPATALLVREAEDETILVHVCPSWYLDKKDIGIKKGDKVSIRGAWVEIEGKDVFIASKIKKGDYFELKVRLSKTGTPFWTMSPEELAKEKRRK